MSDVTVVITSFNRFDLLKRTVDSFNKINTFPVREYIIIEDSADAHMHNLLVHSYPYSFILNETNIGLVESIDKAYSFVRTPYIFHTEDDFEYIKGGFIEQGIKIMENDPMIFRVGITGGRHIKSLNPETFMVGDVSYKTPLRSNNHDGDFWHGFGFQCGLIRKSAYDAVKPYTQYSTPQEFITIRECRIGIAYWDLGYRAVSLIDDYAKHIGGKKSTYGLFMEG